MGRASVKVLLKLIIIVDADTSGKMSADLQIREWIRKICINNNQNTITDRHWNHMNWTNNKIPIYKIDFESHCQKKTFFVKYDCSLPYIKHSSGKTICSYNRYVCRDLIEVFFPVFLNKYYNLRFSLMYIFTSVLQ